MTLAAAVRQVLEEHFAEALKKTPVIDFDAATHAVLDLMTSSWEPTSTQALATGLLHGTLLVHGERVENLELEGGDLGDLIRWTPRGWSRSYDVRVVGVLG